MASLQSNSTFSFKHHLTGDVHYIAKNRHLNIVLQAELYLRTGTYDRPKNTLAIDSARALAIDAYPRIALTKFQRQIWTIDRLFLFGEYWVNPLPDHDEASRAKWEHQVHRTIGNFENEQSEGRSPDWNQAQTTLEGTPIGGVQDAAYDPNGLL